MMELFQVLWDDQRNLILDFKESGRNNSVHDLQELKRLNLKYEISKKDQNQSRALAQPALVSVKEFNHTPDRLIFKIDLSDVLEFDELMIQFKALTLYSQNGTRKRIELKKSMDLSEIIIDEDYYDSVIEVNPVEFMKEEKSNAINGSHTKEQIYRETETDVTNNRKKDVFIYQKNSTTFSSDSNDLIRAIQENSARLARVEEGLIELTKTLKSMKFASAPNISPPPQLKPPPKSTSLNSIPNKPSPTFKKLPMKRPVRKDSGRLPYLGELRSIFKRKDENDKEFNFKDVLKPLSEEELKQITLDEEQLQKKEDEFYKRQLELFSEKEAKQNA